LEKGKEEGAWNRRIRQPTLERAEPNVERKSHMTLPHLKEGGGRRIHFPWVAKKQITWGRKLIKRINGRNKGWQPILWVDKRGGGEREDGR